MADAPFYTATEGKSRFDTRDIVRISASKLRRIKPEGKRVFVPFAGFDGQSLAGTGALVFEGELLELRN
ncbi:MAG: hypothetical protein AAF423_11860 [Pseudomonadota bacterium]